MRIEGPFLLCSRAMPAGKALREVLELHIRDIQIAVPQAILDCHKAGSTASLRVAHRHHSRFWCWRRSWLRDKRAGAAKHPLAAFYAAWMMGMSSKHAYIDCSSHGPAVGSPLGQQAGCWLLS